MQIRPSSDVLNAIASLPADRVPGKAPLAAAQPQRTQRTEPPQLPAERNPSRYYRPGTFLDIFA